MKRFNITVNGKAYDVAVEEIANGAAPAPVAATPAAAAPVPEKKPAASVAPAGGAQGSVKVNAPMPGNILDVKVNVGDSVTSGQVLVILEAMKMENDIVAPANGKITSINVKKGDSVNSNDLIITME